MSERGRRPLDRSGWDQRYVHDELPWDNGNPDPHLGRVIEEHGIVPTRGLEVGCGTGTNVIWLSQQGFEMSGVDLSPTAIERAEAKAAKAGGACSLMALDFLSDEVPGGPFGFVYPLGFAELWTVPSAGRG